ncbi:MAG: hypothetical protein FWD37_04285 [Methanomassiliicoccaceae archaeon]|nr:hypothetical protein [Methanomassiliicoccaceae archaeon]
MGKEPNSTGIMPFLTRKNDVRAETEKKESVFSNLFSAIRLTLIISMLLWWIPIIGQIVSGFVGGRKAGTPARGMVATLVAVVIFLGVMMILSAGLISGSDLLASEPEDAIASLGLDLPLLGAALMYILSYLQAFFGIFSGTTSMKVNLYIITVIFGMIGGLMAEMHSKEAIRSSPESARPIMPRSLAAYKEGKKLGCDNFDDRLAIQQSKVPEQKIVTIHKTLVRKPTAREEPQAVPAALPASVQEAEERESPFAGLIHRAEKNDPEKERARHGSSKEDTEYV